MKIRITLLLITVFSVIIGTQVSGQIGNAIKKRASQTIENIGKSDRKEVQKHDSLSQVKAEEGINEREEEKQKDEEQPEIDFGKLFGGKVTLKHNDAYTFSNYVYMQMETYEDNEVKKLDYYVYYNDDNKNGGVEIKTVADNDQEASSSSFITDDENKCVIMLTDLGTSKMGMISALTDKTQQKQAIQNEEGTGKIIITKTGNSRTIAGYKCDEYIEREEGEKEYAKIWITRNVKLNAYNRSNNKGGLPDIYRKGELENGTVLATESYDEDNKLAMKLETKEIKSNIHHTISLAGYQLRQMQGQTPKKQ